MKQIPNFPNYTITKDGVVTGKQVKKQTLGKNGYRYVTLYSNNTSKKLYIHRLIAELYIPNTEYKRTVNHINGNKQDNCLTNLEWNTDSENIKHAYDNGLNPSNSKVTDDIRKVMYLRFMNGESMQAISNDYSFNNVTVSNHIRKYVGQINDNDNYQAEVFRQRSLRGKANLNDHP